MNAMECVPALRSQLCAVSEEPAVRVQHVAALVAYTPAVVRLGTRMRIRFEDGPTAAWLTQALAHHDVKLPDGGGRTVIISNPQSVLRRYGFREGHWLFEQGREAAVGICRGALHAGATFNRHGMKISCPTTALMLTLTAVMARLGITAKPTERHPRLVISPGDVPSALQCLGIGDVGDRYRQLCHNPPSTITAGRGCA